MKMHLEIFDDQPKNISALQEVFTDPALISIKHVEKMLYTKPPKGLDVLYLPLAAAERWGAKPLIHESRILPTEAHDKINGLPPFIVTGTCLSDDDPRGPIPEMKILLSAVFNAIKAFNEQSDFKLRKIGFWGYDLLNCGVTSMELRKIIGGVAPELL